MLFTDVEHSAWQQARFPDAAPAAIARHFDLIRAAIEPRGGILFNTLGDGGFAVFRAATDALGAAIEAQRALAEESWAAFGAGFGPLCVRMALHTGTVALGGQDYMGATLMVTTRLMKAAAGSEIVLSAATEALVRSALPPDCRLIDLGFQPVEGPDSRERVFLVEGPMLGLCAARERSLAETLYEVVHAAQARRPVKLTANQHRLLGRRRPENLIEYRVKQVSEMLGHGLQERFVSAALRLNRGREGEMDDHHGSVKVYADLGEVLQDVSEPAVVLMGPPGSGKSTLLRRFELEVALDGLRDATDAVTWLVPLNSYASPFGSTHEAPADWLRARWQSRHPNLPGLDTLIEQGRLVLLLDALNEMPYAAGEEYRSRLSAWRGFLADVVQANPGTRAIFTCRPLDYTLPLSSPDMSVPQVMIQPLDDDAIRMFLDQRFPDDGDRAWGALKSSGQMDLMRMPYLLDMWCDHIALNGSAPKGQAALLTGFVRRALGREIRRQNPRFRVGDVLDAQDFRQLTLGQWGTPYDLPHHGPLVAALERLAYGMQAAHPTLESAQVRVGLEQAHALIDTPRAGLLLEAGLDLGVLDEDWATDEVQFHHQLLQEYFAGRRLSVAPAPDFATSAWRAADIRPSIEETVAALAPPDPLPPPPATGWEETTIMAAAMSADPAAYIEQVAAGNLPLAGRMAALPELMLPAVLLDDLRWRLVDRCQDPDADLRSRIAAGLALGPLGDPRFQRHMGPHGEYLLPRFVPVAGGTFVIGSDDTPYPEEESPAHAVEIAPFQIAVLPVTNAEWALFMKAGGYDDERWWPTAAAKAWRQGEGTGYGAREQVFDHYRSLSQDWTQLDRIFARGEMSREWYSTWQQRRSMSPSAFRRHLEEVYPDRRIVAPRYWGSPMLGDLQQPVVGVSWFECLAYCSWLSEQTGSTIRLPSEVEREAATRGPQGRLFAYGPAFRPEITNTVEAHIRRTVPVGVMPGNTTPEGVVDLTGNTFDWTTSLFDPAESSRFAYPYRLNGGHDDTHAPSTTKRVSRGGAWGFDATYARATCRYFNYPDWQLDVVGLRLAM